MAVTPETTRQENSGVVCLACSSNLGVHCINNCRGSGRVMVTDHNRSLIHAFPIDISNCNLANAIINSPVVDVETLPPDQIAEESEWESPNTWTADAIPMVLLLRAYGIVRQHQVDIIKRGSSSKQQTEEALRVIAKAIDTKEHEHAHPSVEGDIIGSDSEAKVFQSISELPEIFIPESVRRTEKNGAEDHEQIDITAEVQPKIGDILRNQRVQIQVKSSRKKVKDFLETSLSLHPLRKRNDIHHNLVQECWLVENGQNPTDLIQAGVVSQMAGLIQFRNSSRFDLQTIQTRYWQLLRPETLELVRSNKDRLLDELVQIFGAYQVSSDFLSTASRGQRKSTARSNLFRDGKFQFNAKILEEAEQTVQRVLGVQSQVEYMQ